MVSAQFPATDGSFEAVSITVTSRSDTLRYNIEGGPGTKSPLQWRCTNVPLDVLVMKAWGLAPFQLADSPALSDVRYDIAAKVPPGTSQDGFKMMIQRLLTERLNLTTHREPRNQRVEELVVAKGGVKMKTAEQASTEAPSAGSGLTLGRDGTPQLPPGYPKAIRLATDQGVFYVGRVQTVDNLIRVLTQPVRQIIINKTGLTGKYDYTLRMPLPNSHAPLPSAASGASVAANAEAVDTGPSIESAMAEQLGLRLQPAKAVIEVFVVDHFNKVPLENQL